MNDSRIFLLYHFNARVAFYVVNTGSVNIRYYDAFTGLRLYINERFENESEVITSLQIINQEVDHEPYLLIDSGNQIVLASSSDPNVFTLLGDEVVEFTEENPKPLVGIGHIEIPLEFHGGYFESKALPPIDDMTLAKLQNLRVQGKTFMDYGHVNELIHDQNFTIVKFGQSPVSKEYLKLLEESYHL